MSSDALRPQRVCVLERLRGSSCSPANRCFARSPSPHEDVSSALGPATPLRSSSIRAEISSSRAELSSSLAEFSSASQGHLPRASSCTTLRSPGPVASLCYSDTCPHLPVADLAGCRAGEGAAVFPTTQLPRFTASPSPFHRITFTFSYIAVTFHCFRCVFYDSRSRGRASSHRSDDLVPTASTATSPLPRIPPRLAIQYTRQDLTTVTARANASPPPCRYLRIVVQMTLSRPQADDLLTASDRQYATSDSKHNR